MPLTRPERFSAFPASSIAPRPRVRTCLGPRVLARRFVGPVRHSGPLITQCHNCKTRRKRIPSRFDSRTRAFRKAKPNPIPIGPTASAANASGSVQTTLSKLPRATHLRTIPLFPRGSPDRVLTFIDTSPTDEPITSRLPVKRGVAANRSLPVDLFVLMQPRNGLARPHAGRISVSEFLGDFAQYGVIVRGLVARHSPPVHRLRCKMLIPIASDHIAVPSFRIGVFLVNKGDATKTIP